MKQILLLLSCVLLSTTLWGNETLQKAKDQSYKHEKNTIFAIKEGNNYHAFRHDENGEVTHLGYFPYDGEPHDITEISDRLQENKEKHMSDTYFILHDGTVYSLYYRNFMGEVQLMTKEKYITAKGKVNDKPAVETAVVSQKETPKQQTSEEDDSSDDDDDSGGGGIGLVGIIIGFWVLRALFSD